MDNIEHKLILVCITDEVIILFIEIFGSHKDLYFKIKKKTFSWVQKFWNTSLKII